MLEEKFLIHRSAILSYKSCPRKAFLEFWYNGHGLAPSFISKDLFIGICVHEGLRQLLEHCRLEHPTGDFEEKCVDDAVDKAHVVFSEILEKRGIAVRKGEDLSYAIYEHHQLVEALVRVYAVYRLRPLLEEYEVLEVEHEEVFDSFSDSVTWLGKADGLFRRRIDGELVVLSIKTTSEFGEHTVNNIRIDIQGCSEIVAVEERLNNLCWLDEHDEQYLDCTPELQRFFEEFREADGQHITIFGVQYEFLAKGRFRKDEGFPNRRHQTHLLHPIKSDNLANVGFGTSGLKFGQVQTEYEWKIPSGRLPKNKRKIDIYSDMGVKEWINKLAMSEVQPEEGDPFATVIYAGEKTLVRRTPEQLNEWRVATQFEAEEIAERVKEILNYNTFSKWYKKRLSQWFRKDGQDAQLCYNYYGEECPFVSICHDGMLIDDCVESGMYITREPHHDLEKERFKEKGWID